MENFWLGVLSATLVALIVGVARVLIARARPVICYEVVQISSVMPSDLNTGRDLWVVAERFTIRNRSMRHLKDVRMSCETSEDAPWLTKVSRAVSVDPATVLFEREGARLIIRIPDLPAAERIIVDLVYTASYPPVDFSRLAGGSSDYRLLNAMQYSLRFSSLVMFGVLAALFAVGIWAAALAVA